MTLSNEQILNWVDVGDIQVTGAVTPQEAELAKSSIFEERKAEVVGAITNALRLNQEYLDKLIRVESLKPSVVEPRTGLLVGAGKEVSLRLFEEVALVRGFDAHTVHKTSELLERYSSFRLGPVTRSEKSLREKGHKQRTLINVPVLLDEFTGGRVESIETFEPTTLNLIERFLDDWDYSNPEVDVAEHLKRRGRKKH